MMDLMNDTHHIKNFRLFNKINDKAIIQSESAYSSKALNSFISLGVYYLKKENDQNNNNKKIYYDVFYRKVKLTESDYIEDLYFSDLTDLIIQKQIILNENLKKQKIFAKIAHEFKTPLNSVIGIANNIMDSENSLSKFTTNKLTLIENLSNYLTFLVSDIIQFSNIHDFTDLRINISTVDIKELMTFSFNILNSLLSCNKNKNENILSQLKMNEDIELLNLQSDEIRLKQVLLNFISNSVKFTKEGKIVLKSKKIWDANSCYLKISVKDTGIGIKELEQKNLFQEFTTNENNELNKINNSIGSGLGLSVSKVLCEKLNVKILVKSQHLKGSTFSILVPCEDKESENLYNINKALQSTEQTEEANNMPNQCKLDTKDETSMSLNNKRRSQFYCYMNNEKKVHEISNPKLKKENKILPKSSIVSTRSNQKIHNFVSYKNI